MPAYITAMGRFLPGEPVPNEEIEDYIGSLGHASSGLREQTLNNCGIKSRHYAIDKQHKTLFSNTDMAVAAIRQAVDRSDITLDDIDLIAAATAIPDLIAPGIASGIHGELGSPPCEIVTTHGICTLPSPIRRTGHRQMRGRTSTCPFTATPWQETHLRLAT